MQRHTLAEFVGLRHILFGHGIRDMRPRNGTQRAVRHLNQRGDVGGDGEHACQTEARLARHEELAQHGNHIARQGRRNHKQSIE